VRVKEYSFSAGEALILADICTPTGIGVTPPVGVGVGVGVGDGVAETVNMIELVFVAAVGVVESVTAKLTVYVPVEVGVPLIVHKVPLAEAVIPVTVLEAPEQE
jgi:hypothetical protein